LFGGILQRILVGRLRVQQSVVSGSFSIGFFDYLQRQEIVHTALTLVIAAKLHIRRNTVWLGFRDSPTVPASLRLSTKSVHYHGPSVESQKLEASLGIRMRIPAPLSRPTQGESCGSEGRCSEFPSSQTFRRVWLGGQVQGEDCCSVTSLSSIFTSLDCLHNWCNSTTERCWVMS